MPQIRPAQDTTVVIFPEVPDAVRALARHFRTGVAANADVQGAHQAGLRTVWLNRGHRG